MLSTGESVRNNLEKINIASASWTTYDISEGLWKVVPNRAASAGELSSAFVFNDDNIIGDVGLTATNLEDLFNTLEVEFPSRGIRDQNEYYKDEIPLNERNDLEPVNILNMRVDLANNALHGARVGLIELKQSRVDLIITFRSDYSGLQVEAGDVVKVTNDVYGFSEKLFRVTKTREVEDESGSLSVEITALAYDADVYADETLDDFAPGAASGIPSFGGSVTLPPPSAPVISNSNPTAAVPNFTISTDINITSGPVDLIEWFYSSSSGGPYIYLANERSATGNFGAGTTVSEVLFNVDAGTWYFKARTGSVGLYSDFSPASSPFVWAPAASAGTANTATFADQVFINGLTSGLRSLVLTTGTNDYESLSTDTDFVYSATSNKAYIATHEVSTNTNAVYGQFLATGTQSIATSTVVAAVTFDESVYADGITLTTSSHINLPQTGKYLVAFSAIFENTKSDARRALMWLRKNGQDEPDTNTAITVPGKHGSTNGAAVLSVTFVNEHTAGDYVELYWNSEDSDITLKTINSSTTAPIYPRSPAVVLSINKISGGYG